MKFALFDLVYLLASTNINQSAPDLVKIYTTLRSWMSSIMGLIGHNQRVICPSIRVGVFWFTPKHLHTFMM